ncbi:hypothetical protein VNI00_015572 [Paramarasmius palmivorus]|uniref:Uncharacterized protein n=1 Tax=Paramarasmius palmivorus TaxID=297713 RepID=A0AAW0BKH5_9AGAR
MPDPVLVHIPGYGTQMTTIDPITSVHKVVCPSCRTSIGINRSGRNIFQFLQHFNTNKKCLEKRRVVTTLLEKDITIAALSSTPGASTSQLPPPSAIPTHSNQSSISDNRPMTSQTPESPSPALPPPIRTDICYGVAVHWQIGSLLGSYFWAQHEMQKLGWEPIGFHRHTNSIIFRSDKCKGPPLEEVSSIPIRKVGDGTFICEHCRSIPMSRRYRRMMDRAEKGPKKHTAYRYLSANQLLGLVARINDHTVKLRSKVQALERRAQFLRRKIDDYSRILILLAKNDVTALRRLLAVALKRGASVHSILSRIEDSLDGLYSPKGGFEKRDLDKAFLAKALGGSRLLYALTKSEGFAANETIRRNYRVPKLRPSLSVPTASDIKTNIARFFDPEIKPPRKPARPGQAIPGNTLMFDGVALESKCRYCIERDAVMGLCREHSKNVDLKVSDLEAVENIRAALFDEKTHTEESQKVCFGSDGTVVAIAPYSRTDFYSPCPIALSPSCKKEKGGDLAAWLDVTLRSWRESPYGECLNGPIWSIGSDEIDPQSKLGKIIHPLKGMNRMTSIHGVIGTSDPKHIMKRFATLLRSPQGITIHDLTTTRDDILFSLEELGMSRSRASRLLDPADKQNVPKATSLIQELLRVVNLNTEYLNPSQLRRRQNISFIAQMMGYFVNPFIEETYDLSQQIRSLSTFAHLAAAMQVRHGSACLTGALYADTQSVIKNIIIMTARLQLIDEDLPFHIIHEGTDRLEGLFGDVRTQDHAWNVDIEQLAQKLSVSAQIQSILERNPDLDRGHRRTSLKGVLGPDHTNPLSWTGDVRVGNVNLQQEWDAGRVEAEQQLAKWLDIDINFNDIFDVPGTDMLRPAGAWVGVRGCTDDLRSERKEEDDVEETDESVDFDESDDLPIGVDIDDFIHVPDSDELRDGSAQKNTVPPAFTAERTLTIEGKAYLKGSVVAALCSDPARKVTMRTLRARGVTLEDLNKRSDALASPESSLEGIDLLKTGDLGAALVRCRSDRVALAVFEIVGFRRRKEKTLHTSISMDELENTEKAPTVVGQILEMETALPEGENRTCWDWTGEFLRSDESKSGLINRQKLVVEFPGPLVYPLTPTVISNHELRQKVTWSIDHEQLLGIFNATKSEIYPDKADLLDNLSALPEVQTVSLPYEAPQDLRLDFQIPDINTPAIDAEEIVSCPLHCNTRVALKNLRTHVGKHIIHGLRKAHSDSEGREVEVDPCGWCGLSQTCVTQLVDLKKGKVKIESTCPYRHTKMRYNECKTFSADAPCTNVPMHCPICPKSLSGQPVTFWKYNATDHFLLNHVEPGQKIQDIDGIFAINIFVTKAEEAALEIELEETEAYRDEHGIPGSDVIEENRRSSASRSNNSRRGRGQKQR